VDAGAAERAAISRSAAVVGHPFRPGDITTYGQDGFACWCDGARSVDDGRAFHDTYTCKTCAVVTLLRPCTDPGAVVGWGALHAH
jgi:hypothetical protein